MNENRETSLRACVGIFLCCRVRPRIENRLSLVEGAAMLSVQAAEIVVVFAARQQLRKGSRTVVRQG
jgi:hypothetical protein